MAEPITELYVGDAHLAERSFAGREDMLGDPFFAFEQVIDLALQLREESAEFGWVIQAGDLFDSTRPSAAVAQFFRAQLDRLHRVGVRFAFIRGNHDATRVPWASAISPRALWIDRRTLTVPSGRVFGLDYRPEAEFRTAVKMTPPGISVLVCHQGWREFGGRGGLSLDADLPREDFDVFSGDTHLHKRLVLLGSRHFWISPGATYLKKSKEPLLHGVYARCRDGAWVRRDLRSRPGVRYELHTEQDALGLLDNAPQVLARLHDSTLPEELQRPIVVIKLYQATLEMKRRLGEAFRGKAHLFWSKPQLDEEHGGTVIVGDAPSEDDAFLQLAEQELANEPTALAALQRLWRSFEPKLEVVAIREERLSDSAPNRAE